MTPDLWDFEFLAAAALMWHVLRIILWFTRKEVPSESTRDPIRFFFGSPASIALAFGALLLLIVSWLQSSTSRALFIVAGGVAALILFGTLIQVIALLVHSFFIDKDHPRPEKRAKEPKAQNQYPSGKVESLKRKHPPATEFHDEFAEKHSDEFQSTPIDAEACLNELSRIPVGHAGAHAYHDFILGALEAIFYPDLRKPVKEERLHAGRKRVDIVFNNGGDRGFFADLSIRHRIKSPYVFFECKNYSEDPGNPEFDQLTGRFSKKRGEFGVLVCRKITNRDKTLQHSRDALNDDRGYVLVLDDSDIGELLRMRARQDSAAVTNYMDDLYRRLVL